MPAHFFTDRDPSLVQQYFYTKIWFVFRKRCRFLRDWITFGNMIRHIPMSCLCHVNKISFWHLILQKNNIDFIQNTTARNFMSPPILLWKFNRFRFKIKFVINNTKRDYYNMLLVPTSSVFFLILPKCHFHIKLWMK